MKALDIYHAGVVELETSDGVIPLRPISQHERVWHLVKHYATDNGSTDQHDVASAPMRVIPEIFLTRLLSTKVNVN